MCEWGGGGGDRRWSESEESHVQIDEKEGVRCGSDRTCSPTRHSFLDSIGATYHGRRVTCVDRRKGDSECVLEDRGCVCSSSARVLQGVAGCCRVLQGVAGCCRG